MDKLKIKSGFTLMEVLLASTIFAMVMVLAAGTFSWTSAYNNRFNEMRRTMNESKKNYE